MYEVELKFPVREADKVREALRALGAVEQRTVHEEDLYFAHPAREFAQTDEALRIRTVDGANTLTYKGPVLDTRTKMRQEIEVSFERGEPGRARLEALLLALGFRIVRRVSKQRTLGTLCWQGTTIGWTWDAVPPLGHFVELELVVDEGEQQAAQERLCALAEKLACGTPERRSYLELLLEADGQHLPAAPTRDEGQT